MRQVIELATSPNPEEVPVLRKVFPDQLERERRASELASLRTDNERKLKALSWICEAQLRWAWEKTNEGLVILDGAFVKRTGRLLSLLGKEIEEVRTRFIEQI